MTPNVRTVVPARSESGNRMTPPTLESVLSDEFTRETFRAHIEHDPAAAARLLFGVEVWPGQERILRSLFCPYGAGGNAVTVVGSGHATGKSYTVALATQLWLVRGWPEVNVVIFAASEDALKTRIFRTIETHVGAPGAMRWGTKPLARSWAPTATAQVVGQVIRGDGEGQQGYHATGGVLTQVDEASALDAAKYETIISGLTTGHRDRVLMVGNPLHTDGPFADALGDGRDGTVHLASLESPNIVWARMASYLAEGRSYDPAAIASAIWEWFPAEGRAAVPESRLVRTVEWVWARVREWGPDWMRAWEDRAEIVPGLAGPGWLARQVDRFGTGSDEFRTRVLGLVPAVGEDELFSRTAFTEASGRDYGRRSGRVILGGDIGAVGDPTVLYVRDDASVIDRVEVRSGDDRLYRARVRAAVVALWEKHGCDEGYLDDTGIGLAIADEIRSESGIRTLWGLMPGGAASDAERFENARAECAFRAREWLRTGAVPREYADRLRRESGIRWETSKTTHRKKLESKPEFKKRLGHSPDDMDAFCYTFGALPGPVAFEAARGLRAPVGDARIVDGGVLMGDVLVVARPWRATWFNPAGGSACVVGATDKLGAMMVIRACDSPESLDLREWTDRMGEISREGGRELVFSADVVGYPEDVARMEEGHAFRREMVDAIRRGGWKGGIPRLADRRWLAGPGGVEVLNRLILGGLARIPGDPYWEGRMLECLRYATMPDLRVWPRAVRDALNHARFEGKKRGEDPMEDANSEFVAGGGPYLRCLRMIAGMGGVAAVRDMPRPPKMKDPNRYESY
jgi:hypothetical protein